MRQLRNLLVMLIVGLAGSLLAGTYGGGTGTPEDPFQIWTAEQMNEIGLHEEDWDKHFVLMDDINMGQFDGRDGRAGFNIIAPDINNVEGGYQGTSFTGNFEGGNHIISNLTIILPDTDYVGMFGSVSGNAEVRNLRLVKVEISGDWTVGGLVGCVDFDSFPPLNYSNFSNCYVSGVVTGNGLVGGMVGFDVAGHIDSCWSVATVTGLLRVGGLVGDIYYGSLINNCYAEGDVTGIEYVGGLVGGGSPGPFAGGGRIQNSYATGIVRGEMMIVGGLIGGCHQRVEDCYSTVTLEIENSMQSYRGGLVGLNNDGTINNSFWNTETSSLLDMCGYQHPDASGSGCNDSYGKTTSEMKSQSTFTNWDFTNTWNIGENQTYPYLRTHSVSDLNRDHIVDLIDLAILSEQWLQNK